MGVFSAYQAIVWFAVAKLHILKLGIADAKLLDPSGVEKLIKSALPHHAEYIEKRGPPAYHYLLDELETRLLVELRQMLEGTESDAANVAQAAEIIKLSEDVMKMASQNAALSEA